MGFASNVILAKAKGMYAKRLTIQDYEELLKKESIEDAVYYLKNETDYAEYLKDLKVDQMHREYIELKLKEKALLNISRLIHYASKKELDFYRLGIEQFEITFIFHKMSQLKRLDIETYDYQIPSYLSRYSSIDIKALQHAQSYQELCKVLIKTPYYSLFKKALIDQENIDFDTLALEVKRTYYQNYVDVIKKHYKGEKYKNLMMMIDTSIELENITKIYRLKKFFHTSVEEIKSHLLLEHSRMSKTMIDKLLNTPTAESFLKELSLSPYKIYIDDKEFVFIEYYTQRIEYNLAKRFMRFSTDPALVFMTYSILLNLEVENLKHVIEGIRYNENPDKVKQLLIY